MALQRKILSLKRAISRSRAILFYIMERWKDIDGFKGKYQVSNKGRVRSWNKRGPGDRSDKPRILAQEQTNRNYMRVHLSIDNKASHLSVHRLVAINFVANPDNKPQINHKDGNPLNNSSNNLEWCTQSENMKHAYASGLQEPVAGERHGASKLKREDVLDIRNAYRIGCFTHLELAEAFNVTQSAVTNIINRKSWKHI